MRILAAALCTAFVAFGQIPRPTTSEPPANTSGITPPASAADYLVHGAGPGVTIGAVVLSPAKIKKLFPINLDAKGYIVVEVGIFPENNGQISVDTDHFRLQVGDDRTMRRPVSPFDIMASGQSRSKTHQPQIGNIPVSTTATIGYESGGPYNRGGVYGGTNTTVGNGPRPDAYPYPPQPGPGASGKDSADIERELTDKELAIGKTTVPVAGYLYFPKPTQKQKNPSFDLTYKNEGAVVHLAIPPTK